MREDLSGVSIGPISSDQGVGHPADVIPGLHHCGELSEESGPVGWAGCPHTLSFLWGKENAKRPQVQLDQWDGGRSTQLTLSCTLRSAQPSREWIPVVGGGWSVKETHGLSHPGGGGSVAASP